MTFSIIATEFFFFFIILLQCKNLHSLWGLAWLAPRKRRSTRILLNRIFALKKRKKTNWIRSLFNGNYNIYFVKVAWFLLFPKKRTCVCVCNFVSRCISHLKITLVILREILKYSRGIQNFHGYNCEKKRFHIFLTGHRAQSAIVKDSQNYFLSSC